MKNRFGCRESFRDCGYFGLVQIWHLVEECEANKARICAISTKKENGNGKEGERKEGKRQENEPQGRPEGASSSDE
jgi:hypothetical protein